MANELLHVGAQWMCAHGGTGAVVSTNPFVKVSGLPVAVSRDKLVIVGCPFTVGPKYQPCIEAKLVRPSVFVKIMGSPAVIATTSGMTLPAEQVPQGVAVMGGHQMFVRAL
jgi:uncharacterized Zn-binding protein involved in type VI secretion